MTEKNYSTLLVQPLGAHSISITLNRPEVRNALNTQMMTDLRDCFREYYVDQQNLRCVLLTGAGEKSFCAGGDLKERNGMTDATWQRQHAILEQMIEAVLACPIPIIAAVNGNCFGGGLELALTADFIYASDTSQFGFPEGKLGIMPGACGTQNLVRACGQRRAKELILSGRSFSVTEAASWGVVNQVCRPAELLPHAVATSEEIAQIAPISARQIKKSVNFAIHSDIASGYAFEIEAYNRTVPTRDRLEGVSAFNEKRKAKFTGE